MLCRKLLKSSAIINIAGLRDAQAGGAGVKVVSSQTMVELELYSHTFIKISFPSFTPHADSHPSLRSILDNQLSLINQDMRIAHPLISHMSIMLIQHAPSCLAPHPIHPPSNHPRHSSLLMQAFPNILTQAHSPCPHYRTAPYFIPGFFEPPSRLSYTQSFISTLLAGPAPPTRYRSIKCEHRKGI